MSKPITDHEGRKYLKMIHPADGCGRPVRVDVYAVLRAFNVTCPGRQQAIKKLLCAGQRGKGDALADLIGAEAALSRAIDFARQDAEGSGPPPKRCGAAADELTEDLAES